MSVQTPKQGLLCGQGEVGFNGAFAGTATPPIHGWYWCGSNAGWERWTRFGTNDNNSVTTQNKTKPLLQSHGTFSLCSRQQSRWLKIFTKSFFFSSSPHMICDLWQKTKMRIIQPTLNSLLSVAMCSDFQLTKKVISALLSVHSPPSPICPSLLSWSKPVSRSNSHTKYRYVSTSWTRLKRHQRKPT